MAEVTDLHSAIALRRWRRVARAERRERGGTKSELPRGQLALGACCTGLGACCTGLWAWAGFFGVGFLAAGFARVFLPGAAAWAAGLLTDVGFASGLLLSTDGLLGAAASGLGASSLTAAPAGAALTQFGAPGSHAGFPLL